MNKSRLTSGVSPQDCTRLGKSKKHTFWHQKNTTFHFFSKFALFSKFGTFVRKIWSKKVKKKGRNFDQKKCRNFGLFCNFLGIPRKTSRDPKFGNPWNFRNSTVFWNFLEFSEILDPVIEICQSGHQLFDIDHPIRIRPIKLLDPDINFSKPVTELFGSGHQLFDIDRSDIDHPEICHQLLSPNFGHSIKKLDDRGIGIWKCWISTIRQSVVRRWTPSRTGKPDPAGWHINTFLTKHVKKLVDEISVEMALVDFYETPCHPISFATIPSPISVIFFGSIAGFRKMGICIYTIYIVYIYIYSIYPRISEDLNTPIWGSVSLVHRHRGVREICHRISGAGRRSFWRSPIRRSETRRGCTDFLMHVGSSSPFIF